MMKQILAAALLMSASMAQAAFYSFVPTNNNNNNQTRTVGSLFQLEVTDLGSNKVKFNFTNQNTLNTAIIGIYIGGPNIFIENAFTQSTGVRFNEVFTEQPQTGFAIEAASTSSNQGGDNFVNGIDEGGIEFLFYELEIAQGNTFASLINSLNSGQLQVGVTGQTNNQGNDQYIIGTSAVPVPAALPLMASALGMFGIARRRKHAN